MTNRIISTRDVPGGNLRVNQLAAIRELNLAPTFARKEKPWTIAKIPKSSTKNVAWHVNMDGINLLFTYVCGPNYYVSVAKCNSKSKVENFATDNLKDYHNLVDLETAVDKYYNEEHTKPQSNEESVTAE